MYNVKNIFSHFVGELLLFLIISFAMHELFSLMCLHVHRCLCDFVASVFKILSKNSLTETNGM